jgi:hypothetical protein
MKSTFVILVALLIAFSQSSCSSNGNQAAWNAANGKSPSGPSSHTLPATRVSAADLIEAYRRSESTADGQYKGKTLAVTGTVANSGRDYTGRLYVNLKADNPIILVHCTYNDAEREAMSALKEGQQVTIRGVCEGRLSTWVVLKDSVLE